jgi:DNA-binding transcriptional ArsR family regulator
MEKPTRVPLFRIEDLETLKVITEPLRLQILEVLDPRPHTINYVAERLGLASSRLYYHFNLLESHGLIRVVETRMVNNIVEKVYWTSAEELTIDNELIKYSSEEGPEFLGRLVNSTLDSIRDDLFRSLDAKKFNTEHGGEKEGSEILMSKVQKRVSNESYLAFRQKLTDVLSEFSELAEVEEDEPDVKVINLSCFMYPSHYYKAEN